MVQMVRTLTDRVAVSQDVPLEMEESVERVNLEELAVNGGINVR